MSTSYLTEPDYGTGKKTLGVYLFGVVLCIILTLIPFGVVMYSVGSTEFKYWVLGISAFAQFMVQVICFLRLNGSTPQSKVNVAAFVFTIIVAVVVIAGSLWIMVNLNYNMMH